MKIKRHNWNSLFIWIILAVSIASGIVACGGGSAGTSPHVAVAPTILTQPIDQAAITIGGTTTFSVVASGDAPLSYQWKRDGVDVSGATGASYILRNVTSADANSTWSVVVRNASGNVASNNVKLKLSGIITVLAGSIGGLGNIDGIGEAARFHGPSSVAVDGAGNVYAADTENHTIRKVSPAGVVTTVAGTPGVNGFLDGPAVTARFDSPHNLALDGAGNVYVSDYGNQTIRKISTTGAVTSLAGTPGVHFFDYVVGLTVDLAGNVYMSDNQAIRKISPAGLVTTLAGSPGVAGYADCQGSLARFDTPSGMVVDAAGNVYVAEPYNSSIRKISVSGLVTTVFGNPACVNISIYSRPVDCLVGPSALALDGVGNFYVAFGELYIPPPPWYTLPPFVLQEKNSVSNINLQSQMMIKNKSVSFASQQGKGSIRKLSPTGQMTTLTENLNVGILALDALGNGYTANAFEIYKISSSGLLTILAGKAGPWGGTEDGLGTAARFYYIGAVAVNKTGNVYVTTTNFDNSIRKIDSAGMVTTLAGNTVAGSADGLGTAASFSGPHGIAVDNANNVVVADSSNGIIRKISPAGLVTTLAGSRGEWGSADGLGAAAKFVGPMNLAVDGVGNVYVSDFVAVRKINPAGLVVTLAGDSSTYGTSVDGLGTAARFTSIGGLGVDGAGNVYVADTYNNTIRKIDTGGMVTTFVGGRGITGSADGFGAAASFNKPTCVAVDSAGNVYVFDSGNFTIRKISPAGMVTTLAGKVGSYGILLGGLPGSLVTVKGLTVDSNNILYVATDFSVLKIITN